MTGEPTNAISKASHTSILISIMKSKVAFIVSCVQPVIQQYESTIVTKFWKITHMGAFDT